MIATPTLHPEASCLICVGIADMDMGFHGLISCRLERSDKVCFIIVA